MIRYSLLSLLMLTSSICCVALPEGDDEPRIEPDGHAQAVLRSCATPASPEAFYQSLRTLNELAKHDEVKVIQQLMYFRERATEPTEGAVLYRLFRMGTISERAMLEAVLPHMVAQDRRRQKEVRTILALIEGAGKGGFPDFSYYASYFEGQRAKRESPNSRLVLHMFEVSPSIALLVCAQAYEEMDGNAVEGSIRQDELKSLRWSDHIISDAVWRKQQGFDGAAAAVRQEAIREAEQLSKYRQWWARLYVAEIIREHKELRTPELIARLEKDEHPLVRKLISERDQKR